MPVERRWMLYLAAALLLPVCHGCGGGGPPAREDITKAAPEDLYGSSMKALIYEFRAKVRRRGVAAAKDELPLLIEAFEGYEEQPIGAHKEAYKEIVDKLNSMKAALEGTPNREQIVQGAEELGGIAEKLPGKAEENPQVE